MKKQLPKNWVETSPLKISKIIRGVSYGKTDAFQEEFENSCLILRGGNIQEGDIVDGKDNVYVDLELIKEEQLLQKYDVIIVGSTGSKNLIGKAATALYNSDKISFGAFLMNIRAFEPINKKYFSYYFQTNYYREVIRNLAGGVNINNIRKEYIENLYFPLPPLAEQNRIVEKLDTLFGQLEIIKNSMANIPLLLKDFRQQVLTQAVTGKLTEEWRKGKKLGEVELITKINKVEYNVIDYSEVPSSWEVTALGNYAIISRGKFTPRPRNDPKYFDGNYPFMQIGDLPREGGITSTYSKTLNELGKDVSKSFEKNTVVIAIVGATIGNTGILSKKMFFPDSLIGINCLNEKSNIFIEYFLRVCKYGLREISYSSGGQPNINTQVIKGLEVGIPSIEEQQEILGRVESLFANANNIEKQYRSLKQKIDNLPQALLHKAFKGELTEQLNSDGDARDLLKQIQELKNSAVKPKKGIAKKVKNYPEKKEVLGMVAEEKK
ncbi:restriction endonuclease subunit S [Flavobacterium aquidurense]|uniref:restriction endonuclease subunit S n=1 Tax=Flavobacterium aquidurense TaxID=362413 RepID=UPI003757AE43